MWCAREPGSPQLHKHRHTEKSVTYSSPAAVDQMVEQSWHQVDIFIAGSCSQRPEVPFKILNPKLLPSSLSLGGV